MNASTPADANVLGYLTFVDFAQHGVVGGYLLVNRQARPVEFHCSAPVRPNRAQEILYGPTLRPYLLNEQIGQALVAQASRSPELILSDEPHATGLRALLEVPVCVLPREEESSWPQPEQTASFSFQGRHLFTCRAFAADQGLVLSCLQKLTLGWDFAEPLERIRAAIHEAQRAAA